MTSLEERNAIRFVETSSKTESWDSRRQIHRPIVLLRPVLSRSSFARRTGREDSDPAPLAAILDSWEMWKSQRYVASSKARMSCGLVDPRMMANFNLWWLGRRWLQVKRANSDKR